MVPSLPAPPSRANSFDLLRLLFASAVAVNHLLVLSAAPAPDWLLAALLKVAHYSVQGFFVLSGYLVTASLERSGSLAIYGEKRIRRLYPAYAVVVTGCALGALAMSEAARADIEGVARYLAANLAFLNFLTPELPGVFQGNPHTEVNGALWTIKIEVMFYLALPALATVLNRSGRYRLAVLALIYVAAELWAAFAAGLAEPVMGREIANRLDQQLPGQLDAFAVGMALHYSKSLAASHARTLMIGGALMSVLIALAPVSKPLEAAAIGSLAIGVGAHWRAPFDAARFGDLSYGVYITHFPIIQMVIAAGLFAGFMTGASIAMAATLAAAILLWRFVERPVLRKDSAYRAAERHP